MSEPKILIKGLDLIEKRFNDLSSEYQMILLKHQYGFQNMFAQNIYKQELKSGNIEKHPRDYELSDKIEPVESFYWEQDEFFAIIDEWPDKVPKFKFRCLGNYIYFFQAIFHEEYSSAIESVAVTDGIGLHDMKSKYKLLSMRGVEEWVKLEKYFYLKGKERIEKYRWR